MGTFPGRRRAALASIFTLERNLRKSKIVPFKHSNVAILHFVIMSTTKRLFEYSCLNGKALIWPYFCPGTKNYNGFSLRKYCYFILGQSIVAP